MTRSRPRSASRYTPIRSELSVDPCCRPDLRLPSSPHGDAPTRKAPVRSPGTCRLCQRPLEVESESGLCPTCLRTADTSLANPRPSLKPPVPLGSDAPPGDPDATGTFAPRPPEASTATGAAGAGGVDTRAAGVTPLQSVPLPPAPAGYDLFVHLGGGGWGDVFLAREHVADRLVAMKFLRAAGNPTA